MPTFSCAAILFDLDGVLVDSTRAVDREWREWALRKGIDGDAVMAIAHGVRTLEVTQRVVCPHLECGSGGGGRSKIIAKRADQQGVLVMPGAAVLVRFGFQTGAVGRRDFWVEAAGQRAVALLWTSGAQGSGYGG